jgi:hypothetical protein
MNIPVLTPAVPSRGDMLAEAIASVRAQILAPTAHLVGMDPARIARCGRALRVRRRGDVDISVRRREPLVQAGPCPIQS